MAVTRPGDQWAEPAKQAKAALGPVRLVTTDEVLTEFLNALADGGEHLRRQAAKMVRAIQANTNLTVLPPVARLLRPCPRSVRATARQELLPHRLRPHERHARERPLPRPHQRPWLPAGRLQRADRGKVGRMKKQTMQRKITHCPTCDSPRIRRVRKNLRRTFQGRTYVVPNLEFDHCPDCGEHLYDRHAMRKIQAHSPAYQKPPRAAAR